MANGGKKRPKVQLRIFFALSVVVVIALFFAFGLHQYFTLEHLKSHYEELRSEVTAHPTKASVIYFAAYILITALSLPGAVVMTLAGGALFGLAYGTVLVSFASTIGATLAFLTSRFLLRDFVQTKFSHYLEAVNKGVQKSGGFYLFTLRLIPAVPFFVINLVMGLLPFSTKKFYSISQVAMLPGTLVYVNAGTRLGELESLKGILSFELLASLALLGLFPWLAKKGVSYLQVRRKLARFRRPAKFDFDIITVGGGAAGLVTSYIGAAVKAKTALVEMHKMGGDCLNFGCVPSKSILRTAKAWSDIDQLESLGLPHIAKPELSFAHVMERVQQVISAIEPNDSIERYESLGVKCFNEKAEILSPYEVRIGQKIYTTRNVVVATGAAPRVPKIPGLKDVPMYTSDTLWSLRDMPKRLLVMGGGPIGCELSLAFARLGSQITLVEKAPRLLVREDPEVSDVISAKLSQEGVKVKLNTEVAKFSSASAEGHRATLKSPAEGELSIPFDAVLLALGREARVHGFGLIENLGAELNAQGLLETDEYLRVAGLPNVFACGDVVGPFQLTHAASHQAWHCAVNALFRPFKQFKVDYRYLPWCTYTDPEVARIGLNETEARARGIQHQVVRYDMGHLDRALADGQAYGFIKVIVSPKSDKILGVTYVSAHAGDLIAEFVLAMKYGLGLNKILSTIHSYPTWAEANKMLAGNWKKQTAPQHLLRHLERYFAWRRS